MEIKEKSQKRQRPGQRKSDERLEGEGKSHPAFRCGEQGKRRR